MVTLALDTSAGIAVSLVAADGHVLAAIRLDDDRHHAELLAGAIRTVLDTAALGPADVTAVAAGTGPAPFTGLRAGLVTARTFAFARGLDAEGVPTFDGVALQAAQALNLGAGDEVAVLGDARRKEVYWSRYRVADGAGVDAQLTLVAGPDVAPPAALVDSGALAGCRVVATGTIPVAINAGIEPDAVVHVDPAFLAVLAAQRRAAGTPQPTAPLYLRRPDAQVPAGLRAS